MTNISALTERIRQILRPYSLNWGGARSRGDVVIPQREVPQILDELLDAFRECTEQDREATDDELFDALMTTRRSGSIQDQMTQLRNSFRILRKKP